MADHEKIELTASEVWWLLIGGVLIGLVGLDGVIGIIGKPALGSFYRVLAFIVMFFGFGLVVTSLFVGFRRILKWTWKH